jgi:hypothetical protein
MNARRVILASGVVVEEVGGDLMVMVPGSTEFSVSLARLRMLSEALRWVMS